MTLLAMSEINFSGLNWKKILLAAFIVSVVAAIVLTARYVNRKYLSDPTEEEKKNKKKR